MKKISRTLTGNCIKICKDIVNNKRYIITSTITKGTHMKVKGSAVATLPVFVKEKFGEAGFKKWLDSLSPEAQGVFEKNVIPVGWFPLEQTLSEPTKKICDLFYSGNVKGAWDSGRFSAEQGLKGVYKVFIKLGSVAFITKKASTILPTYYEPSEMKVIDLQDKNAIVHITRFDDADETIDHRIGGWMEKALELSGCKMVKVSITKSLAKGDPFTEFQISWG